MKYHVLMLGLIASLAAGCASHLANPPSPRAETGYVDLIPDSAEALCWDVREVVGQKGDTHVLYSNVKPLGGRVLRLALAPGSHRLRVNFLNRVVLEPPVVEVAVQEGMVTPVDVGLADTGTLQAKEKRREAGATYTGRVSGRSEITTSEAVTLRLTPVCRPAVAYRPLAEMGYGTETQ